MKRFLLPILLSIVVAFCADAQLLYKISGNGLSRPSYIFGTHHLSPLSILDSVPEIKEAFRSTESVVGEVDMSGNMMVLALKIQPYMKAPADSTLSRLISPEELEDAAIKFKSIMAESMPAMTLQMCDPLRPSAISSLIANAVMNKMLPDFDINQQLDSYFQKLGKEEGKKIIGLETPEQQAELLYCSMPLIEQAKNLIEMLGKPEEIVAQAETLNKAYFSRDLQALHDLSMQEEMDPEFMESFIWRRNAAWVEELPEIISGQPAFIAVGALHLPGEKGVLQLLRNLGYEISPIK